MQTKKRKLEFNQINPKLYNIIIAYLKKKFNCDSLDIPIERLFVLGNGFLTVCYFSGNLEAAKITLSGLRAQGLHPYCLGVPLLIIKYTKHKNSKKIKIKPLFNLINFLKNCKNKIILNERIVQKLSYGKPIDVDLREINSYIGEHENNKSKLYVIETDTGITIGFSRIFVYKNKARILPVLDIGWYLREGK
jgi:hypothetical protein